MPHELEYIVDQAVCYCDKGAKPDYFKGLSNQTVKINGCKVCTKADKKPLANIPSFGVCAVTGSACVPAPIEWTDTYKVKVKGEETLLFKSKLPCSVGGKIEFMTSGQIPVPQEDLDELMEEYGEEEEEGLSWWDAAEMIPFVGGVIGVVRSGAKGDWLGVGLSVVSIGLDVAGLFSFGAGNAASGAVKAGKLARIGHKVAKASSKVAKASKTLKAGGKLAAKALANKVDDFALKNAKVCVFACFPEGTFVHTDQGVKCIEEIRIGDQVWSFDEDTEEIALQEVTAIMQREVDATVFIELEGETIETTAEHPFYTQEGWKDAADLTSADQIKNKDKEWKQVKSQSFQYEKKKVFNFEVNLWHTYFVGALAWLVHNAKPCLSKIKHLPSWLSRMYKGNYFNFIREQFYKRLGGFNEVVLETGKRLDSYLPGKEIISRKFSQLGEVSEQTAKKYIDELAEKYKRGTPIKQTSRNAEAIGQGGKRLDGDMILEVPVQKGKIPQDVIDHAKDVGVKIRDINGTIY